MSNDEWLKFRDFVRLNPSVGEKSLRRLAAGGKLRSVTVGRRLLVHRDALRELSERQRETAGVQ